MASILAVNAHFVSLAATAQRFDVGFFFFAFLMIQILRQGQLNFQAT